MHEEGQFSLESPFSWYLGHFSLPSLICFSTLVGSRVKSQRIDSLFKDHLFSRVKYYFEETCILSRKKICSLTLTTHCVVRHPSFIFVLHVACNKNDGVDRLFADENFVCVCIAISLCHLAATPLVVRIHALNARLPMKR